jgi:hypothetical protein
MRSISLSNALGIGFSECPAMHPSRSFGGFRETRAFDPCSKLLQSNQDGTNCFPRVTENKIEDLQRRSWHWPPAAHNSLRRAIELRFARNAKPSGREHSCLTK